MNLPLHPIVVHFPIALLILGAVIEIINVFAKKDVLSKFGTMLIVIGVLTGFVAYSTGEAQEEVAEQTFGEGIESIIETHSLFAAISIAIFIGIALIKIIFYYLKKKKGEPAKTTQGIVSVLILVLSIAGIISLAYTGHNGGKIVYGDNNTIINNDNTNIEFNDGDED